MCNNYLLSNIDILSNLIETPLESEFEINSRIGERSERRSGNLSTVAGDGIEIISFVGDRVDTSSAFLDEVDA